MNHSNTINKYFNAGRDGAGWYDETRQHVAGAIGEGLADLYIDILAATSPQQSVKGNVTQANKALKQLLDGKAFTGYLPIVAGMLNVIRVNYMTGIRAKFGGHKVQAFADAMRGDLSAVVVDRWMLRAFGYPERLTDKRQRDIAGWINRKAERVNMEPAQVQAAIWCGIKRLEDETGFSEAPIHEHIRQVV